ncbi:phosphoenolpyruvate carboxylase [Oenococcus kitaharae]|uniref:phosphoenolpyruvate carboxylase n=1 Tax=Oenococcus TaxID=46254 RepID=UPI0021E7CE59|nr:phosphoenolpyruvate carboxylase [Oenococcus kitaharae]MCV3297141.1 phosphoenolpyruvate carboxylase [Oenococcus kitaharae]
MTTIGRRIPNIMGTQHPDNAAVPFFKHSQSPFISAYNEVKEAFNNFSVLDTDEYMWDWEGKHADAAVIDRLYSENYSYFKKNQLGRDKFLTFRLPNIWEEKGYSLMQAMATILSAEDFAKDLSFDQRPLFEAILPMAQSADQLIEIEDKFASLAHFKSKEFTSGSNNNDLLYMIPLFEGFETQLNAPKILKTYLSMYEKHFGQSLQYLRVFLAGSDSALSNGFMNSIIGNKLALTRLADFSDEINLPVFPIAGTGSTIFRGGLSPLWIKRYLQEFPGLKTATVQSAFRYDYPTNQVQAAIKELRVGLQESKPLSMSGEEQQILIDVAKKSAVYYHETLDQLIVDLQPVFDAFPKRRDRRQHVGILGYSRQVDGYKMPRAITFTGSLYSVGVPPEFIGFGRALMNLDAKELAIFVRHYPNLKHDFVHLAKYISQDALNTLIQGNPAWAEVRQDIQDMQKILQFEIGPSNENEEEHARLASDLVKISDATTRTLLIEKQALLRRFLG